MSFIARLRSTFTAPQRGFIYVSADDEGPMKEAQAGRVIRAAHRGPPWMIVDHEVANVIVTGWPGRLWQAEILDPITAGESKRAGSPLISSAGYTRAAGVRILHEVPVATLFGHKGAAVAVVIDEAANVTRDRASRLAAARHEEANAAQTRTWRAWLARQNPSVETPRDAYDGVLVATAGDGRGRSPVGGGLMALHRQLCKRAEAIAGASVWIHDPDDDENVWLDQPWSGASDALLDAALAFGAADFVTDSDRAILAKPWREVIGADPN